MDSSKKEELRKHLKLLSQFCQQIADNDIDPNDVTIAVSLPDKDRITTMEDPQTVTTLTWDQYIDFVRNLSSGND